MARYICHTDEHTQRDRRSIARTKIYREETIELLYKLSKIVGSHGNVLARILKLRFNLGAPEEDRKNGELGKRFINFLINRSLKFCGQIVRLAQRHDGLLYSMATIELWNMKLINRIIRRDPEQKLIEVRQVSKKANRYVKDGHKDYLDYWRMRGVPMELVMADRELLAPNYILIGDSIDRTLGNRGIISPNMFFDKYQDTLNILYPNATIIKITGKKDPFRMTTMNHTISRSSGESNFGFYARELCRLILHTLGKK
jgi:hypothetical protein